MDFIQKMKEATGDEFSGTKNRALRQRLFSKAHRVLDQGDDAVQQGDDAVQQGDDQYVNDDGLDLREYAFKYVGCQTIGSWSDNLAADEESSTVLAKNTFAVFRLCPSHTCSTYNHYGCEYDYGEYMILMQDYLEIMSENHYKQYAEFCSTCDECMSGYDQNVDNNDDGGNNDDAVANDDAVNNRRRLDQGDDAVANDDAAAGDDAVANGDDGGGYQCQYADACANYQEACANYSDDEVLYDNYFGCAQNQGGNDDGGGNWQYLGPHCMSDGKTISIGVYEDEYCQDYLGTMEDVGLSYDDTSLAFFASESCVSCDATVRLV